MNLPRTLWDSLGVTGKLLSGLAAVFFFSFFVNLLILVSPIYMMQVFDRVLTTQHLETLIYLSMFAGIALIVLGLLDGVRGYLLSRIGVFWDQTLRSDLLRLSIDGARMPGRAVANVLQDLQTVRQFVASPAILPFLDAPWTPAFLFVIFLLHWWLGLLATAAAVLLFSLALANDRLSRPTLVEAMKQQGHVNQMSAASIRNADVVHAMGMFGALSQRLELANSQASALHGKAAERSALITASSKAIRIGVQVAILGLGAYLVVLGELSAGGMIGSSIILGRALAPIEQSISGWRNFVGARTAYLRIRELCRAAPAPREAVRLPAPDGKVSIENAGYRVPGRDKPVVQGVKMDIEPGTVVAIVGPSASGKSSLCRMIVGSWTPMVGNIRLDGADISQWNQADIGQHVGYLPQSVELFAGSVKDNIARMGNPDDATVVEAAQLAGCHDLILQLPNGYETDIGEAGAFLSGGQRQRIGLARALYGKPKLIVLDEPNSNLDHLGEQALVNAMSEMKKIGSTIILVSHRLTIFGPVDKIAVMQDGMLDRYDDRDVVMRQLAPGRNIESARPVVQSGVA
ncbi:type I secretion system permease/ATPase [Tepidamorphus sp. 3E244]|uniref:type I secretion system permease/ATPase n=1 Tax=Tepidamorphus sp. 3E244 TaxID=3385498 RepID=UPI0038FC6CC7